MKVCFENIQYNFSSYNFRNSYGSIVSICSVGFVLGVENISNFRLINSPCLFQLSGFCFSATPIIFLSLAAVAIIFVKRLLKISRGRGPVDGLLSAHSPTSELDLKLAFCRHFQHLFQQVVAHQ